MRHVKFVIMMSCFMLMISTIVCHAKEEQIIVEEAIIGGDEDAAACTVPDQKPATAEKVQPIEKKKKTAKKKPSFSGSVTIIHTDAETLEEINSDLYLYAEDGRETEIGQKKEVTGLKAGSYTIREKKAVNGYRKIDETTFVLSEEEPEYLCRVESDRIYGSIEVRFMVENTEIDGSYKIIDEDGEDVTDKEKLPLGKYENGVLKAYQIYTVKDVVLPDGYETDFMEQQIVFSDCGDKREAYRKEILIPCKEKKEEQVSENTVSGDEVPIIKEPVNKHRESLIEKISGWFMEVTNGAGIGRIIKVILPAGIIGLILTGRKKHKK